MRSMKALLATGLVIGTVAAASPAHAGEAPALRGTTVITGSEAAQMRVRLPAPITTASLSDWDFEITGDGRIIYFLLIKERRDGSLNDKIFLEGYAVGKCAEEACASQTEDSYGGSWEGLGESDTMPAGRYRLFLVADGAPARIELQLADLSGRTQVSPSKPAVAQIDTLTPHFAGISPFTYFGYSEAPFRGEGTALLSLWFTDALAYGHCIYRDEKPETLAAYLPNKCDDGTHVIGPDEVAERFDWGFNWLMPLPQAMGTWYTKSSVLDSAGSVAMWLQTSPN